MFNLLFALSFFFQDFLGFCRWRKKNRNQSRLNITSVNWDTIKGPIKALIRPTTFAYGFCILYSNDPLPAFDLFFWCFQDRLESYFMDRKLIIIILHFKTIMVLGGALWGFMELGFGIFEIMRAGNKSFAAWYLYIDLPKPILQTFPSDPFQIIRISPLR